MTTTKTIILIILGLFLSFFWSCDETVELNNSSLFDPAVQGQLSRDTLYAELDTTFSIPKQSTRNSTRLMAGSFAGFTFRPIIRFDGLPTNAVISQAHIRFITAGITGGNPQPFVIRAHPIREDWTSDLDPITYDSTITLGSMEVTVDSADTIILPIDTTALGIITSWADEDSSEFNYGIVLNFDGATFVKEFNSNRNTLGPRLVFTYTQPGDTARRDSLLANSDAFLVESNFSRVPDRNHAVTMTPWVTLLQFNTDTLWKRFPDGIVFQSANLQLSIDSANTFISNEFGPNLHILPLTSELSDEMVSVDSSRIVFPEFSINLNRLADDSSFINVPSGSERRELAQYFMQDQLEDLQPVKKLYVGFQNNVEFISYIAFMKRDSADLNKRPRLILEYWIPPSRRY